MLFAVRRLGWMAGVGLGVLVGCAVEAGGQVLGMGGAVPVYLDDSPTAEEAVGRARELAAVGNVDEAAGVLTRVLAEEGSRVVVEAGERGGVGVSMRTVIHEVLLGDEALLGAFRALNGERARALLEAGAVERVERDLLLTDAGFEAAMVVARRRFSRARFAAAWLVLEQLEGHPLRVGSADAGGRAAGLLARVAAYAGHGEGELADPALVERIAATLDRWRSEAGLSEAELPTPGAAARPAVVSGRTVFDPMGGLVFDDGDVLARPVATEALSELPRGGEVQRNQAMGSPLSTPTRALLHAAPAVADGRVYVNDGASVRALEPLTLEEVFSVEVSSWMGERNPGRRRGLDEVNTVTVAEGVAVAVSELGQRREAGDERVVVALDAETGRPLWRRTLHDVALAALDGGMVRGLAGGRGGVGFDDGAVIRGTPVVVEGVVVLGLLRVVPAERLMTESLFGLDLRSGELLWVRPLVSTSEDRRDRRGGPMALSAGSGGLVIRSSRLGVTAAVEARTGRVRWIDQHGAAPPLEMNQPEPSHWEAAVPIVRGDVALTIERDGMDVVERDRWTGRVLTSVASSMLRRPWYAVEAEGGVAFVGDQAVVFAAGEAFDPAGLRTLVDFAGGGSSAAGRPVARVVSAGDALLMPVARGVALVPTVLDGRGDGRSGGVSGGGAGVEVVSLQRTGHVVPTDSGFVVADDVNVYSYASWGVAREGLLARIEAEPADPGAAMTFARLAVQAGKNDEALPAIDRSIAAIEADPLDASLDVARSELFRSVLVMLEPWRVERGATEIEPPRIDDVAVRGALVRRLARVASGPTERVAYLFAAARQAEAEGEFAEAARRYQGVLDSESLSGSTIDLPRGRSVTAAVEAAERLRGLVETRGRGVYAAFEEEARAGVAAIVAGEREASEAAGIARRYPVAVAAGQAWAIAGVFELERDRHDAAAFAFGEAARARADVERVDGAGVVGESVGARGSALWAAGVGELELARVEAVAASGRASEAFRVLRGLVERGVVDGGAMIEVDGRRVAVSEAGGVLLELAQASAPRLPRLGGALSAGPTIAGFTLVDLALGRLSGSPTGVAVVTSADGRLGLIAADGGEGGEPGLRWSVRVEEVPLTMDGEVLYTVAYGARGGEVVVVARDLRTGDPRWRTPGFASVFDAAGTSGERVRVPVAGTATLDFTRFLFTAEAVVVVETSGRVAAFDRGDGSVMWSRPGTVEVVHDASASNGVLTLVGGDRLPVHRMNNNHPPGERLHRLVVVDLATGEPTHRVGFNEMLRWCAAGDDGVVIVGAEQRVFGYDPVRAREVWSLEDREMVGTDAAVVLPGRVIVRGRTSELYLIDRRAETPGVVALETASVLDRGFRSIDVRNLGGATAVTTMRGVGVYDASGDVIGLATAPSGVLVTQAAFGENLFVFAEMEGAWDETGTLSAYAVDVRELPSGRLVGRAAALLPTGLTGVGVIDGWVLVSGSHSTVALRAEGER